MSLLSAGRAGVELWSDEADRRADLMDAGGRGRQAQRQAGIEAGRHGGRQAWRQMMGLVD